MNSKQKTNGLNHVAYRKDLLMSKVKKAVIPAAGLGTRFLPATKALAKEMLPIVDKPTIQFIVEEALKSGIEDILVVTGKSKRSIEDHFDSNFELEYNLKEKGKNDLLKLVDETTGIGLHFIRQSHPRGLGDAVLQAKAFVGNEPFVVLLQPNYIDFKQLVYVQYHFIAGSFHTSHITERDRFYHCAQSGSRRSDRNRVQTE